jgi:hypothetical protein
VPIEYGDSRNEHDSVQLETGFPGIGGQLRAHSGVRPGAEQPAGHRVQCGRLQSLPGRRWGNRSRRNGFSAISIIGKGLTPKDVIFWDDQTASGRLRVGFELLSRANAPG